MKIVDKFIEKKLRYLVGVHKIQLDFTLEKKEVKKDPIYGNN